MQKNHLEHGIKFANLEIKDLEFLSTTGKSFRTLDINSDVYQHITDTFSEYDHNALVLSYGFNPNISFLEIKSVSGMNNFKGLSWEISSVDIIGYITAINKELQIMLQKGNILDIDYTSNHRFEKLIPEQLLNFFERTYVSNYIYIKGFIDNKGLIGCILIISPKRFKANNLAVIDYYTNICTIALQKRTVEIELKNHDIKFESKLKRRTQKLEEKLEQLQKEKSEIIENEHHLEYIKNTLADSLSKEKELNELKTRFIETVSHEYRTPLTVIQTSTYILQRYFENNDAENFQKQLEKIIASVKDMTDLLQDILTYGRGDHESISPKAERFGIISFVNDIIESQKIIDNGRHRISLIVNSNSREVTIYSDMRCVQYVFGNILQNAIKYSPPETDIDIILTNKAREICIEVRDRGKGIPENELDYLFEPFFRGSKVNTIPGTGLGLAIAKRYTDLLEGSISVRSKIDVGTVFTFCLPKIITRK